MMRTRTFWWGYFALLSAVVIANYGIEAVHHPMAFRHHWPLTVTGLVITGVNLVGLAAFIRRHPLLHPGFWRMVVFADLALYGWAGGRIVTKVTLHPAGMGLLSQFPFTLAGVLLLPLPLFLALYRYSQRPGVWEPAA